MARMLIEALVNKESRHLAKERGYIYFPDDRAWRKWIFPEELGITLAMSPFSIQNVETKEIYAPKK